jgi:hypothetical protein
MSIPAPIKPSDLAKFKQTYLNNLKLEASNNAKVLEAQRRLEATGEVNRAREDTRTTTEQRADLERLRIDVLGDMKDITDGTQASLIVARLNGAELLFVADSIALIKRDMKDKYSRGVPSDIFVPYVQQLMRNAEQSFGVSYGLQSGSASEYLLNQNTIGKSVVGAPILGQLRDLVGTIPDSDMKRDIITLIGTMERQIPTTRETKAIKELDTQTLLQVQKSLSKMLEDVPTNSQVIKSIGDLEIAISKRDSQEINNVLMKLGQLLALDQEAIGERDRLSNYFEEQLREKGDVPSVEGEIVPIEAVVMDTQAVRDLDDFKLRKLPFKKEWLIAKFNKGELPMVRNKTQILTAAAPDTHAIFEAWEAANLTAVEAFDATPEKMPKPPTSGSGITKHAKSVANFASKIDTSKGIAKLEYTPFGRYFINTSRLNDGVMQLRTNKNTGVPRIKTTNISKDLASVFKTIAGGSIPSFDELSKLDKKDHAHLYTVAKECKIADRLSLQAPNKSEIEKENDRFFLLKGQIQSGNDNEKLVKEFKRLLLKMLHERRVPRREALDILEELVVLGY